MMTSLGRPDDALLRTRGAIVAALIGAVIAAPFVAAGAGSLSLIAAIAAILGVALAPSVRLERPLRARVVLGMAVVSVVAGDALVALQLAPLDGSFFLFALAFGLMVFGLPALCMTIVASFVWASAVRWLERRGSRQIR
jgi:hypothetical protein